MRKTRPWLWPRAAYIHVPFCAHHCGYCDFAVVAGQEHLIDRYLDALTKELAGLGEPQSVDTLFIGGGTPTHLSPRPLNRLLEAVTYWLRPAVGYEFSVEVNPSSLDKDKVALLAAFGVNRISLGVQSFQAHLLRFLERDHSSGTVIHAVELSRRFIPQLSLDLIFGTPGQTLEQWQSDLNTAVTLGPDHISTYGLTYEQGTPLWKRRQQGKISPLDEETELALYTCALDNLGEAGFEHYEISNHARPGKRCRHNETYWANHAYFGFGVGAARYLNGRRELNTRNLGEYLQRIEAGELPLSEFETLPLDERARETVALHLRRAEGINRSTFHEQTGFALDDLCGSAIKRNITLGLLNDDGTDVCLSRPGKMVADSVISTLLQPDMPGSPAQESR